MPQKEEVEPKNPEERSQNMQTTPHDEEKG
jgi:hypothetical protein